MVTAAQREMFDDLLESMLAELPPDLHDLLEEVPLIVEDEPSPDLLRDLGLDPLDRGLCGLHTGVALTERSVEAPAGGSGVPDHMMIFRGPIIRLAGWRPGRPRRELERQIRITVLHEIGHHFGLDEEDLDALGYG